MFGAHNRLAVERRANQLKISTSIDSFGAELCERENLTPFSFAILLPLLHWRAYFYIVYKYKYIYLFVCCVLRALFAYWWASVFTAICWLLLTQTQLELKLKRKTKPAHKVKFSTRSLLEHFALLCNKRSALAAFVKASKQHCFQKARAKTAGKVAARVVLFAMLVLLNNGFLAFKHQNALWLW